MYPGSCRPSTPLAKVENLKPVPLCRDFWSESLAVNPDFAQSKRECHDRWSEDEACGSEGDEAADEGDEKQERMQTHARPDEHRIKDIVGRMDDPHSVHCEDQRLNPMPGEEEEARRRHPYHECADDRQHGEHGHDHCPE